MTDLHQKHEIARILCRHMPKSLVELFQDESRIPEGLPERIFALLEKRDGIRARNSKIAWGASSLCLLAIAAASGWNAAHSIGLSNFQSYASLLFSDTGTVITYWRELGISLMESLPLVGIGLCFA